MIALNIIFQIPLAPIRLDEIELDICSRLFPISLDRSSFRDSHNFKIARVYQENEKYASSITTQTEGAAGSTLNYERPYPSGRGPIRSRNSRRSILARIASRELDTGFSSTSRSGRSSRSSSRSAEKSFLQSIEDIEGDNGLTKKLKLEIRRAQVDEDRLPILQEVSEEVEPNTEVDRDLKDKAKKLIDLLKTKHKLKDAISKKEIKELEETLGQIENKGYKKQLKDEFDAGSILLSRLATVERLRHAVSFLWIKI